MKGLLLKDIINLRQQLKVYLVVIAVWMLIAITSSDGSFFGGLICVIAAMIPITALSYDERAKWDKYGLTMPISKKEMVVSKYLLAIFFSIIGFIVSLIFNVIVSKNFLESLEMSALFCVTSIFFVSIILPLIYKFGVEKGRIMIFVVFLIPTVLVLMFKKINVPMPSQEFLNDRINVLAPILGLVTLAVFIISAFISIEIYRKKEL